MSPLYDQKSDYLRRARILEVKAGLRKIWHCLEPDAKARSAIAFFAAYVAIVAAFGATMSYVTKMIATG